jgi:hypothetical protein
MAWVMIMVHIAMANDAAPWLEWIAMIGISSFCIPCCTRGESMSCRGSETKKPGIYARAIRFLACCLTWLQYAGK